MSETVLIEDVCESTHETLGEMMAIVRMVITESLEKERELF